MTMDPMKAMHDFLHGIGAKKRGTKFILDGFDGDCYLIFDAADVSAEFPETAGTVDILVSKPGCSPNESKDCIRVVAAAGRSGVKKFLRAIGIERLPAKTRMVLNESPRLPHRMT